MIPIIPLSGALLLAYWVRWIFWKRKEQPVAVPVLVTCFFLPKINLLKVSSLSTAGIRADDLLALVLLLAAVMDPATYRNKAVKWGFRILLVLSAVNLLSVVAGRMYGYDNQILLSVMMVIRKFEYGSFALTGIFVMRRLKNPYRTFMTEFTVLNLMYLIPAALQVLGKCSYAVNGADAGNYFQGSAVSTFNGYYEYGQVLCFGCAVFICDLISGRSAPKVGKFPVSLLMLPLTLGMLVLSKSRTSLVFGGLLILIAVFFPVRSRISRPRLIAGGYGTIAVLAVVTVFAAGMIGHGLSSRFGSLDPDSFLSYWREFVRRGNFHQYREMVRTGYFEFDAIDDLGYLDRVSDWSMATRMLKWGAALDGFRMHPLLGYGTGVTHVMDGNYIRLLGETGLLGTLLWLGFYFWVMREVWKARREALLGKAVLLMMLSILLNSLMIDMFDASKPMEMMWLLAGAVIAYPVCASGRREGLPAGEMIKETVMRT